MPYSLLATLLISAVVLRFVAMSDTGLAARISVFALLLATIAFQLLTPWFVAALAVQGALGIGVALHAIAKS